MSEPTKEQLINIKRGELENKIEDPCEGMSPEDFKEMNPIEFNKEFMGMPQK